MQPIPQRVEETALNAWPALQTLVYDGWLVRFANNYTKRANSVTPLYVGIKTPEKLPLAEKIARCEAFYANHQQRPIFRLPSFSVDTPALDAILEARGYQRVDETIVQCKSLHNTHHPRSNIPQPCSGQNRHKAANWLPFFHAMEPKKRDIKTHQQMLDNIVSPVNYAVLTNGTQGVACGLGVCEGGYVGLFDIVVDAQQRRQGYGRMLVEYILNWGRHQDAHHAHHAYLQVEATNAPAIQLYETVGFTELYRYWYWVKEETVKGNTTQQDMIQQESTEETDQQGGLA